MPFQHLMRCALFLHISFNEGQVAELIIVGNVILRLVNPIMIYNYHTAALAFLVGFILLCHQHTMHSHLVLMYDVPVWFSACPLIHVYKRSYPSLEYACGGRAERPQMVYANDNTSLIHQIKFRRNRYPWAHPLWFVEWSSTWWPMHLWHGLPK